MVNEREILLFFTVNTTKKLNFVERNFVKLYLTTEDGNRRSIQLVSFNSRPPTKLWGVQYSDNFD